jgi:hypothetical protein
VKVLWNSFPETVSFLFPFLFHTQLWEAQKIKQVRKRAREGK